jgi:hypothetical protein
MFKNVFCVMLALGITGTSFAQRLRFSTKKFDPPANSIGRTFEIKLDRGNKIQIEVTSMEDLQYFDNMDSLIRMFLQDIAPLKDSLANELFSKRIDYILDSSNKKKIWIKLYPQNGSSFLVQNGNVSALKLEQDTIHFIGMTSIPPKSSLTKKSSWNRYYRLSIFINQLSELPDYADGRISSKISELEKDAYSGWKRSDNGINYLKADPVITTKRPISDRSGPGDFIGFDASANIQNYKNYFTPSFNVNVQFNFNSTSKYRELNFAWEPYFLFSRTTQGNTQTFRNDFVSVTWGGRQITEENRKKETLHLFAISIAYLVNHQGDLMDPHTFRVGVGRLQFFGGITRIEPILYFHDFFKGVSPGIRLVQKF